MPTFTKEEQNSIVIFKNEDTKRFLLHFLCNFTNSWWSLGHTSYENQVIIIELNTSPSELLRSSALGAMFGVASTKEIGTRKPKNMNN